MRAGDWRNFTTLRSGKCAVCGSAEPTLLHVLDACRGAKYPDAISYGRPSLREALCKSGVDETVGCKLVSMLERGPRGGTGRLDFLLAVFPQAWYDDLGHKYGSTTAGRKRSAATAKLARTTFAHRAADIAISYVKEAGDKGDNGHSYQPRTRWSFELYTAASQPVSMLELGPAGSTVNCHCEVGATYFSHRAAEIAISLDREAGDKGSH